MWGVDMLANTETQNHLLARPASWGATVTVVCVLATLALACATPFAGLAALAAIFLRRRDAFALIGLNWVANQAIGFGLMHYPLDWSTIDGGLHIGIAAMASVGVSVLVYRSLQKLGAALAVLGTLLAAFVANEAVLLVLALGGPFAGDFNVSTELYILYVNGFALVGLLGLQALAAAVGLVAPAGGPGVRVARAA
jgi:hypothetical protein